VSNTQTQATSADYVVFSNKPFNIQINTNGTGKGNGIVLRFIQMMHSNAKSNQNM
jgi:hypothetical protein